MLASLFSAPASAQHECSTAVGYPATAVGYPATAVGYPATAVGYPATAVGYCPDATECVGPLVDSGCPLAHGETQCQLGSEFVTTLPLPRSGTPGCGGGPATSLCSGDPQTVYFRKPNLVYVVHSSPICAVRIGAFPYPTLFWGGEEVLHTTTPGPLSEHVPPTPHSTPPTPPPVGATVGGSGAAANVL